MPRLDLKIESPAETERLGFLLAGTLVQGDVVALSGPLGAGKSILARAIIRRFYPDEQDIPSPTFTLVQTYSGDPSPSPSSSPASSMPTVMHFDLYRLETPEEALELGIEDAFVDAISVIEWAENLGRYLPRRALVANLNFEGETGRNICLEGGSNWQDRLLELETQFAAS